MAHKSGSTLASDSWPLVTLHDVSTAVVVHILCYIFPPLLWPLPLAATAAGSGCRRCRSLPLLSLTATAGDRLRQLLPQSPPAATATDDGRACRGLPLSLTLAIARRCRPLSPLPLAMPTNAVDRLPSPSTAAAAVGRSRRHRRPLLPLTLAALAAVRHCH